MTRLVPTKRRRLTLTVKHGKPQRVGSVIVEVWPDKNHKGKSRVSVVVEDSP